MTVHILRDYQTASAGYSGGIPSVSVAYIMAIFLRRVLGFSVVGQTNFNIDSFLQATGIAGSGNGAGINFSGAVYAVSIPSSVRTVSSGDIGKVLCLKSTANPLKNSGVFSITGVDVPNNRYVIDYRSGDTPPPEAADSMTWYLFASETTAPSNNTGNGGTGYLGNGSATCSRIVLQSPHASAWQIRFCYEPSPGTSGLYSYSIGYGANSSGDFPINGQHTHTPLFHNEDFSLQPYSVTTFGDTTNSFRITLIGNDTGQCVIGTLRSEAADVFNQCIMFGIPNNEPNPLPSNLNRIFTYGGGAVAGSYVGFVLHATAFGTAYGLGNAPIIFSPSAWTYLTGAASVPSGSPGAPQFDSNASDSPFIGGTELFSVDAVSGQYAAADTSGSAVNVFQLEPRLMGTIPFIRQGRANFGNYTLTSDKAWLHLQNGMYLQWGGTGIV